MIAAEPVRKGGLDENFKSLATRGDRGFLIGQMILARQRTRRVRSWREASSTDNGHACQPLERRWNVSGSLRPQPDKPPPASEPRPTAPDIVCAPRFKETVFSIMTHRAVGVGAVAQITTYPLPLRSYA